MSRKKRITICLSVLLCVSVVAAAIGLAASRGSDKVAKVLPVSMLSGGGMDDSLMTTGYIQTAKTQEIYLDATTPVKQLHVEEGAQVQIGDPILTYDSTLKQLELERQKISIDSAELYQQMLAQEIEKLKNTPASAASSSMTGIGDQSGETTGDSSEGDKDDSSEPQPEAPGSGTQEDPLRYEGCKTRNYSRGMGEFKRKIRSLFHTGGRKRDLRDSGRSNGCRIPAGRSYLFFAGGTASDSGYRYHFNCFTAGVAGGL